MSNPTKNAHVVLELGLQLQVLARQQGLADLEEGFALADLGEDVEVDAEQVDAQVQGGLGARPKEGGGRMGGVAEQFEEQGIWRGKNLGKI